MRTLERASRTQFGPELEFRSPRERPGRNRNHFCIRVNWRARRRRNDLECVLGKSNRFSNESNSFDNAKGYRLKQLALFCKGQFAGVRFLYRGQTPAVNDLSVRKPIFS